MNTSTATLDARLLAMVHAFEGGGLAGDFDGAIASWGPIQANLGTGTLQPVLRRIHELDTDGFRGILPGLARVLGTDAGIRAYFEQHVLWSSNRRYATPAAIAAFGRLAELPATSQAFAEAAGWYLHRARRDAIRLGLVTERGLALCFDAAIQNGGIRHGDHMRTYWERLTIEHDEEWERLKVLAHAVSLGSKPQWQADVLSRKLTIAVGRGTVHGRHYELADDFGVRYFADREAGILAAWHGQ